MDKHVAVTACVNDALIVDSCMYVKNNVTVKVSPFLSGIMLTALMYFQRICISFITSEIQSVFIWHKHHRCDCSGNCDWPNETYSPKKHTKNNYFIKQSSSDNWHFLKTRMSLGVSCHCQTTMFFLLIFLSDLITARDEGRQGGHIRKKTSEKVM